MCNFVCKGRPRSDLYCVGWDIKPYSLTHFVHLLHLLCVVSCDVSPLVFSKFKCRMEAPECVTLEAEVTCVMCDQFEWWLYTFVYRDCSTCDQSSAGLCHHDIVIRVRQNILSSAQHKHACGNSTSWTINIVHCCVHVTSVVSCLYVLFAHTRWLHFLESKCLRKSIHFSDFSCTSWIISESRIVFGIWCPWILILS